MHAVPRPLEAPRPTALNPARPGEGSTEVTFFGAVDVHGPSTEQLTAEAPWEDPVDDLSLDGPSTQRFGAVAFTTRIHEEEDLAVLFPAPPVTRPPQPAPPQDVGVNVPGFGPVWVHGVRQQLGDTRHHLIDYRFRASTRFREYFDVAALIPRSTPTPTRRSSPWTTGRAWWPANNAQYPSSARPAPPIVHSVLPLLRWDEGTEPEQPVALLRRRRGGVRIYLERSWFSSGDGRAPRRVSCPGGEAI